jgi:maleylpyruvate isomerase
MSRRISAALRDEIVEQYVGGSDGRAAEIEAGAARTAQEIVADVSSSAEILDSLFATMPGEVWERAVRTVGGGEHAVSMLPFRRWREAEVHLVDLGLGSTTTPKLRCCARVAATIPTRPLRHLVFSSN